MRQPGRIWIAVTVAGVLLLAAALAYKGTEGYFSPIISPDGRYVYFVTRTSAGLLRQSFQIFPAPARVFVASDRFRLCRVRLDGSGYEVLESLPSSPLEFSKIREYSERPFGWPSVTLRFEGSQLRYQITLSVPRGNSRIPMALDAVWTGEGGGRPRISWKNTYVGFDSGEDSVRGDWEVLAVAGSTGYPCAVAAYNFRTSELRVLRKTPSCGRMFPGGIRWQDIKSESRGKYIRRLQELRAVRAKLIAEGESQGLNEIDAILRADRLLGDMGYYPRPPQITARLLGRKEAVAAAPVFEITDMEFNVGLFEDIRKAIESPGTEIERTGGKYIIHDDFDTSRKLNEFLTSGAKQFYVRTAGRTYEMTLKDEVPPLPFQ